MHETLQRCPFPWQSSWGRRRAMYKALISVAVVVLQLYFLSKRILRALISSLYRYEH